MMSSDSSRLDVCRLGGLVLLSLCCQALAKGGAYVQSPADVEMGYALRFGNLKGVAGALKGGADINKRGSGLQTPVMAATLNGHVDIVKLLLSKKADVSIPEQEGYTPIHGAAFQGRPDIMRLLIKHGMNPHDLHTDGFTPIHRACWGSEPRHAETVQVLLEAGVPPNQKANNGDTPISIATNPQTLQVLNKALKAREKEM